MTLPGFSKNRFFKSSILLSVLALFAFASGEEKTSYFSPVDIEIDLENGLIYPAEFSSKQIKCIDLENGKTMAVEDLKKLKQKADTQVGFGASDVVISPDGKMAYVSNQFSDDISVVDLSAKKEVNRIPVLHQPKALEISKDCKSLLHSHITPPVMISGIRPTAEIS